MALAANNRALVLECCREALIEIAKSRPNREVSADDAARWLYDYDPHASLGNAAGSLFRGGDWEFTGRWTKSTRVISHANDLRIWRLKET